MTEFSKRLQQIFDYYDLNASAFADKIDVGRASISHLLSGRNKPSLDFVMRVIKTFPEVELYWLLNGKGEFPKSSHEDHKPIPHSTKSVQQDDKPTEKPKVIHEDIPVKQNHDIERIVIFYKNGSFKTYTPD